MGGMQPITEEAAYQLDRARLREEYEEFKRRIIKLEEIVLKGRAPFYITEGALIACWGFKTWKGKTSQYDHRWKHPNSDRDAMWTQEELQENRMKGLNFYGEDGQVYKEIPK